MATSLSRQIRDLEDKKAKLQKQINWVESIAKLQKDIELSPVEHRLAHALHEAACKADHINQCDYFYDENFNGRSKKTWVEKVEKILTVEPSTKKVFQIISIL